MNVYDVLLALAVLAALALAVRACVGMKRRTGSCCGCCASCPGCAARGGKERT